jgi:predicted Fe-S protein YdhL (DUF1289 family)
MPAATPDPRDPYDRPDSPCIGVCTLDDAAVCVGCRRTTAEIALWTRMSPAQQWAVVLDLPERPLSD